MPHPPPNRPWPRQRWPWYAFAAFALHLLVYGVMEFGDVDWNGDLGLAIYTVLMVTWPLTLIASLVGTYVVLFPWLLRKKPPVRDEVDQD